MLQILEESLDGEWPNLQQQVVDVLHDDDAEDDKDFVFVVLEGPNRQLLLRELVVQLYHLLASIQKLENLGVLLHLEFLFDFVSDKAQEALLTVFKKGAIQHAGGACSSARPSRVLIHLVALLRELDQVGQLRQQTRLDHLHGVDVLLKVGIVSLDVHLQIFLQLGDLLGRHRHEPRVKVVGEILEHSFDFSGLNLGPFNFLLDGRGCQSENHRSSHG